MFLSSCLSLAAARRQKKAPRSITLCDYLAHLVLSFVAIERARTKKAFLLWFMFAFDQQLACTSEFICPPERAGRVHTGGARACNALAEAFVSVLLRIDRHDVDGMKHHLESFRLKISRCSVRLTVNYVLFVCT
jgi:hypothetical protein